MNNFTICISENYYKDFEEQLIKYFENNVGKGSFVIRKLSEFPFHVIIDCIGDIKLYKKILDYFMFKSRIDAMDHLVIPINKLMFEDLGSYDYIDEIVNEECEYSIIEANEEFLYLVFPIGSYGCFDKVLNFLNSCFDKWYL
jgi:hypothetical protein